MRLTIDRHPAFEADADATERASRLAPDRATRNIVLCDGDRSRDHATGRNTHLTIIDEHAHFSHGSLEGTDATGDTVRMGVAVHAQASEPRAAWQSQGRS